MHQEGDPAPDLALDSTAGPVSLAALRETGTVVLLFYSEDATPACTRELQPFVADHADLEALGARVLAVSVDDLDSHARFAERLGSPFPLAADPNGAAARSWGVFDEAARRAHRAVFVIGRDGRIRHANRSYTPGNASEYEAVIAALGD